MKSNKLKKCFYCYNDIKIQQKRFFCSETCSKKYWKGVYKKYWKEGDAPVMEGEIPTAEELEKEKQKTIARKLAYSKYKKGILECDICKKKTKNIRRHQTGVCMLLCTKCHGFVKRYNNLKVMLIDYKGGKTK